MKKIFVYICLIATIFFNVACQETPEQAAVVNKNDTDLQLSSNNEQNEIEDAVAVTDILNENYIYTTQNAEGTLSVVVDAEVIIPQGNSVPSADVEPMQFSQEMVTGIFNYLFPHEKPYAVNHTLTKKDIEQNIIMLKEAISSGEQNGLTLTQEDIGFLEEQVEILESEYAKAPETENESKVSDGKLLYDANSGCMKLDVAMPANDACYMVVCTSYDENASSILGGGIASSNIFYNNTMENFTMDGAVRIKIEDELPNDAGQYLNVSLSEAIEQANGIFEAAGISDVQLFDSYLIDNHGTGDFDDSYSEADTYAYKLYYSHSLQGVNVAATGNSGISMAGAYDVPWGMEEITVIVGNEGILSFEWSNPCETTGEITNKSEIIDFDAAVEQFEKSIMYMYSPLVYVEDGVPLQKSMKIKIDKIVLTPIRLKQKDHPGEYLGIYTPAYLFYGSTESVAENLDSPEFSVYDSDSGLNLIIAINAINGSIINPMEGY